jgi:hypothetical protein
MADEMERIWREEVEIIFRHLSGGTEKIMKR